MELFEDAYSGEMLRVSWGTHERMKRLFPELDLPSYYRAMDAHLQACPRSRYPRKIRSFLIRNAKRETARTLRNAGAWRDREDALQRELRVGSNEIQ